MAFFFLIKHAFEKKNPSEEIPFFSKSSVIESTGISTLDNRKGAERDYLYF